MKKYSLILFDKKAVLTNLRLSPKQLVLAVILGVATIGVPYSFAVLGERLFGNYPRIFQTYFSSMTATRLVLYPVYFIMFALLFVIFTLAQADALPAILFLLYIFGTLIFTHVTPINGREMSRANGAMLGMALLYFIIAKVVTYFYKKSGNIYVCAMLNAAFIVWLSINTQQLIK